MQYFLNRQNVCEPCRVNYVHLFGVMEFSRNPAAEEKWSEINQMVYNHIRGVGTYGPLRGVHKAVVRGAVLPLKGAEPANPISVRRGNGWRGAKKNIGRGQGDHLDVRENWVMVTDANIVRPLKPILKIEGNKKGWWFKPISGACAGRKCALVFSSTNQKKVQTNFIISFLRLKRSISDNIRFSVYRAIPPPPLPPPTTKNNQKSEKCPSFR